MNTVIGEYVHPMILPYYEEIRIESDRRVAVVRIAQGISKPYVVRSLGREDIYIRVGSASRFASREKQAELFTTGGMADTETFPVPGSRLADLSRDRLNHYLTAIMRYDISPPAVTNIEDYLYRLGFMVELPVDSILCTVAGILLFGHIPRRLMRQAGMRWIAYEGKDDLSKILDDRFIDGPLIGLRTEVPGGVEFTENGVSGKLLDVIQPFISEESNELDTSLRRVWLWHYPIEAFREAIINALIHRDWTLRETIQVTRYVDRLEITSPGGLKNSMTIEKMVSGYRSTRNPLIATIMRDYGYVEARGMGVRNKIIPLLLKHNGIEPEFIANKDYLKVVFRRKQL